MTYEYIPAGQIPVDSGQIAIGDPCYYLGHPESIGDGNLHMKKDEKTGYWAKDENGDSIILDDESIGKKNAYSLFCEATLTGKEQWGSVQGLAFNTSTTHGDGSYDVTVVADETGQPRGVYICLDGSNPDITVHEPSIGWDEDDDFE